MKLFKMVFLGILAAISFSTLSGCSKVPAGNVGVKVYLYGGDKGVDNVQLSPGRYWISWNEELFLFPTFTQNYVWTKADDEGSPGDESISFQTKEGLVVNADVGISYHIQPNKVSVVFQKFRKGIGEITDIYLRNYVRDALVNDSADLPIESVYGEGKVKLIQQVQNDVQEQVKDIGIIIEKVYWIGDLRLPQTVVKALNAKIEATQKAQQRDNEIATAKAEAEIVRQHAKGKADALLMQATAQAQANLILAKSITPELVQYKGIETWDGKLPVVTSGATPFINMQNLTAPSK